MSLRIMEQVFNSNLKPSERLIMLCLADNSTNEGVCFPSQRTIEKKSGLTRPTISSNIKKLEESGYLLKKYRSRKKGGRSSNKYLIFPSLNASLLCEEDYELFEDLLTQSKVTLPPPQSKVTLPPQATQSKVTLPESEPSLKDLNRHLPLTPQNINENAFDSWCVYKGKKYSNQGKTLSANKLAKYPYDIQQQMVDNSIINGWAGLFEPKQQKQNNQSDQRNEIIDEFFEEQNAEVIYAE